MRAGRDAGKDAAAIFVALDIGQHHRAFADETEKGLARGKRPRLFLGAFAPEFRRIDAREADMRLDRLAEPDAGPRDQRVAIDDAQDFRLDGALKPLDGMNGEQTGKKHQNDDRDTHD
ncbi:MAG: hypothetical protein AMXMBFR74_01330 [Parvibaculum sp.]